MGKKKCDVKTKRWLEAQVEYHEAMAYESENMAEEYMRAIDRYKRTGTLPRDIRN